MTLMIRLNFKPSGNTSFSARAPKPFSACQIKLARTEKGWKQDELATLISREYNLPCCQTQISNLERRNPRGRAEWRIADAIADYFLRNGWEFDDHGSFLKI